MWKIILMVLLLGVVLPAIVFRQTETPPIHQSTDMTTEHTPEQKIIIKVKDKDSIIDFDLEEYVLGVVLGEMPASFEYEALKAQAIATRTYTLRKLIKQSKHEDADICMDAKCCQAFTSVHDYLASKGDAQDLEKVESAVYATKGEVLTYNGELIEATYFSCSGGMTEDAVAVWGTYVPYLQSVESPGEDQSKHYETTKTISKDEFLNALGLNTVNSLNHEDLSFTYSTGSGVETMSLMGEIYTGTQLRTLLNLPSTAFIVEIDGENVFITTRGYGHRVGMSQYGADAMALNGNTYDEILSHYYRGTALTQISHKQLQALFDKE